ncbi:hypothetical protein DMB90_03850 [Raoultella planticola]|uniref:Uncharacterized protein n=1 Tax=Raoultella planticola TaxID=575 RepID=A0A5P6A963_RAOPL|nr:hypothetical protein DMB90_03850 [Raoultella planticola]
MSILKVFLHVINVRCVAGETGNAGKPYHTPAERDLTNKNREQMLHCRHKYPFMPAIDSLIKRFRRRSPEPSATELKQSVAVSPENNGYRQQDFKHQHPMAG